MANFKTNGKRPQVGRSNNPKSHTFKKVCHTDFGGGINSQSYKKQSTTLHLITYNIRTLQSDDRLEELEEELSHVEWDILGLSETRRAAEMCITLKTGHVLYQNNKQVNHHLGAVAILINKRIKH